MQNTNLESLLHQLSELKVQKKQKQNPNIIARELINEHTLIYYGESFYKYLNGRYISLNENDMKQIVNLKVQDDYRQSLFNELYDCMIAKCSVKEINVKHGINLLNGVYDLDKKELIPHSPSYLFTTQLQTNYDKDAKYPKFNSFLLEMLGDDLSKVMILQEYAGYCLDININAEMILFILGRGANGKSVFCDVLKTIIGKGSYETISLDDLRNKNYIADLLGKLVNISTESQAKAEVYESILKRLASGEEIKADKKFKDPFNFKSNCKHIYSLNNLPRVGDKTDAFFRRVVAVPFNKQVDKDKRILGYGEIIAKEESSGLFNWMLEGYYRLQSQGYRFTKSEQVEVLMDSYRKDNNNVLDFFDERLEITLKTNFITNEELYKEYQKWCNDTGSQALKRKNFLHEIYENFKDSGIERDKINGSRGFKALSLTYQ